MYDISHAYLEAADFGSPCKRLRLYAVLCLRRHVVLSMPVAAIKDVLGSRSADCLCSGDLVFDRCPYTALPPAALRYKRSYEKSYGLEAGFYDISQNLSFVPGLVGQSNRFLLLRQIVVIYGQLRMGGAFRATRLQLRRACRPTRD